MRDNLVTTQILPSGLLQVVNKLFKRFDNFEQAKRFVRFVSVSFGVLQVGEILATNLWLIWLCVRELGLKKETTKMMRIFFYPT